MGIAAPYRSLSQRLRRPSLNQEENDHGHDESPSSVHMDCSSDHHSFSSDQGYPDSLKNNTSYKIKRNTQHAQDYPQNLKPGPLSPPSKSPHLNPLSLAHPECLSDRTIYSIKGLSVAQACSQAMFRPTIRVYPPPYGRPDKSGSSLDYLRSSPFIEHIDITTVWKGLLLRDAEQLLYLDRTFKDCLEDVLAETLDEMHEEFQQQCAPYHDRDSGALVISSLNRPISFALQHLVLFMSQSLKLSGKILERGSTRDFEALLPLFLVSCDCLMDFEGDSRGDTAVDICLRYCDPSNEVFPIEPATEAAWIPDMLSFNKIDQFQREGQELIIIPRYCGNAAFAANITRTDIQYSVEPPEPWITWDQSISGFRGKVPLFSEAGCVRRPGKVYRSHRDGPYATTNVLQVEIRALLTAGYGSRIRLQRTLRVRLTFKILPPLAHDSASASTDDHVAPFCLHYPECDSPAPSSISCRSVEDNEDESSWSAIASDDLSVSAGSQSSRAASGLKIPFFTKRHGEDENKRHVLGTFNPDIEDFSIANLREEVEECRSRSTTPEARSSCSVWTLHSRDNLSPMHVETHNVSVNVDKIPEANDSEMVSVGTMPFDESQSTLAARKMDLDPIYASPVDYAKSEAEANSAQQGKLSNGQCIDLRITSSDGNLTSGVSQSKRLRTDELCDSKLGTYSNARSGISNMVQSSHDGLCTSNSGSRHSSSTMDIIVENPDDGPRRRREQAILWNVLSIRAAQSNDKGETMSADELKHMCTAMKMSVREEEDREMAKMGFSEAFDDIFISSCSDSDVDMDESNDQW